MGHVAGIALAIDTGMTTQKEATNSPQANHILANFNYHPIFGLTADCVCSLMRYYGVTIRDLAAHMGITQKRVRQVRTEGILFDRRDTNSALYFAMDWVQGIEGCSLQN